MAGKVTKQLQEKFQKKLIAEENKLHKTIEEIKKEDPFLDPDHSSDNAAIDTDVREQLGHETVEATVKALEKKLCLVETALAKMEKGTYGLCEHSKDPIPLARLKLVPEARYCIEHEARHI